MRSTILGLALCLVTSLGPASAVANAQTPLEPRPAASVLTASKTGWLRVSAIGRGSYTVTGKRFRATAKASRKFRVPAGTYTVRTNGGSPQRLARISVRAGEVVRLRIALGSAVDSRFQLVASPFDGAWQGCASWSPDGSRIAFGTLKGLVVKNLATGGVLRVRTPNVAVDVCPVWLPGATQVAIYLSDSAARGGQSGWAIADLSTKRIRELAEYFWATVPPVAGRMPLIDTLRRSPSDIDFHLLDIRSGERVDITVPAPPNLDPVNGSYFVPFLSPDGTQLAFSVGVPGKHASSGDLRHSTALFVLNLTTGQLRQVSHPTLSVSGYEALTWSPDGTRIAYLMSNQLLGNQDQDHCPVYVVDVASGTVRPVPPRGPSASDGSATLCDRKTVLRWSPDGTRLTFTATSSDGGLDIYVADLETGSMRRVSRPRPFNKTLFDPKSPVESWFPSWSPDGTRILFYSNGGLGDGRPSGYYVRRL